MVRLLSRSILLLTRVVVCLLYSLLLPASANHIAMASSTGENRSQPTGNLVKRLAMALLTFTGRDGAVKKTRFETCVRELVGEHLYTHRLSEIPREGVAMRSWVRFPETVKGHTDACRELAQDFGPLLGLSDAQIRKLADMLRWHETDEIEEGDTSIHSLSDNLKRPFVPKNLEQKIARRRSEYERDKEKVTARVRANVRSWERDRVLALIEEFCRVETPLAIIANEIDVLQGVVQAGTSYIKMHPFASAHPRQVKWAWKIFTNFHVQGVAVIRNPVFVLALKFIYEFVLAVKEGQTPKTLIPREVALVA